MSATASDSDGTISHVDFLVGTTVIATATVAPYHATWSNVPAGTYSYGCKGETSVKNDGLV